MRRCALVLYLVMLCSAGAISQKVQTIVPVKPVVTGAAFQVQFVVTGATDIHLLGDPVFDHFRVVSGPNYYRGNIVLNGSLQHVENIAYTLVPLGPGSFHIKGITVTSGPATHLKSADADVTVVNPSADKTSNGQAAPVNFYAPTTQEGMNSLIRNNLFVRVNVNKRQVLVGEPVVAVFTLYSRLPSFSEVIKTPGFYGFSVLDMLDISEPRTGVESVNGVVYNTSVLRKVQLYPSVTGRLVIDEMHVANNIQLEDSASRQMKEVNYELVTKPVTVEVRPLPNEKPAAFNGAVGSFTVDGSLARNVIRVNEQGRFILKLAGKGNFIQFGMPEIHWPPNILAQDPMISERFKKDTAPLEGQRTFEFPFTAETAEDLVLAPVRFTYFDPSAGRFITLATDSLPLHVQAAAVRSNLLPSWMHKARQHKGMILFWIVLVTALVFVASLFLRRKRKVSTPQPASVSFSEKLQAIDVRKNSAEYVCTQTLNILNEALQASGSPLTALQEAEWKALNDECHLQIYAGVTEAGKTSELKKRALGLLRQLET